MNLKKYDIVLINFPFSDLKRSKIRPAIIISALEGENLILCQITTKKRTISKYEVKLNKNFCGGDIRFDSNIYTNMIFTLHKSLIINKIGYIKENEIKKEIDSNIKKVFNF
jgi:mRNA interferase MazF